MGQKRNKKNGILSNLIYVAGSAALVVMLAFSTVNFIRDARILRHPVLSGAVTAGKETKDKESADFKTLKYQKPAPTATPKPKATEKKSGTAKPTATPKPAPTAEP